jgi:hypothetical protein
VHAFQVTFNTMSTFTDVIQSSVARGDLKRDFGDIVTWIPENFTWFPVPGEMESPNLLETIMYVTLSGKMRCLSPELWQNETLVARVDKGQWQCQETRNCKPSFHLRIRCVNNR